MIWFFKFQHLFLLITCRHLETASVCWFTTCVSRPIGAFFGSLVSTLVIYGTCVVDLHNWFANFCSYYTPSTDYIKTDINLVMLHFILSISLYQLYNLLFKPCIAGNSYVYTYTQVFWTLYPTWRKAGVIYYSIKQSRWWTFMKILQFCHRSMVSWNQ